jgi:hypothetical protein
VMAADPTSAGPREVIAMPLFREFGSACSNNGSAPLSSERNSSSSSTRTPACRSRRRAQMRSPSAPRITAK